MNALAPASSKVQIDKEMMTWQRSRGRYLGRAGQGEPLLLPGKGVVNVSGKSNWRGGVPPAGSGKLRKCSQAVHGVETAESVMPEKSMTLKETKNK